MLRFANARMTALIVCAVVVTFAQVSTCRLGGTVQDPSGAVIPSAQIAYLNEKTGIQASTIADAQGQFLFPSLAPGLYTVGVEAPGFQRKVFHHYELTVSEIVNELIVLGVGEASFSIEVEGSPTGRVQTADAQISRAVTMKEIDTLPQLSRDPMVLTRMQPGVAADGGYSRVNGTRQGSNNTKVDGINANDPSSPRMGLSGVFTNTDSVAEFRMVLNGAKAEYGRNAGAQVELVTRSGANQFHGNLFDYLRNTALNANDFFNNAAGIPRPRLIQNIFGGSLGGPVRRDRTFFFFNYQGQRRPSDMLSNRTVLTPEAKRGVFSWRPPGSSEIRSFDIARNDPRGIGIDREAAKVFALLPDPNNFDLGDGLNTAGFRFNSPSRSTYDQWTLKTDHNLGSGHRLFFRYSWGKYTVPDSINGTERRYPDQPNGVQPGSFTGYAIGSDWNLTPRAVNELRVGRTTMGADFIRPARLKGPTLLSGGLYTEPIHPAFSSGRAEATTEITDSLSVVRGNHTLKTGISFQFPAQSRYNELGIYPDVTLGRDFGNTPPPGMGPSGAGVISSPDRQRFEELYNNVLGRISQVAQTFYGNLETFQAPGTPLIRNFRVREYGAFFQDDWRVSRRLTVNLGLRWELFAPPFEADGSQGRLDKAAQISEAARFSDLTMKRTARWYESDWNNLAPRFGFSFDPRGDGKTAIRGSYGMYYDRIVGAVTSGVDNLTPGFVQALSEYPNRGGNTDVRVSDGIPVPRPPAAPQAQLPPTRSSSLRILSPGLRQSYVQHFNFSVQRAVARNTVVEAAYVGTRGVKLYLERNLNQVRIYGDFLDAFRQLQAFQSAGTPVGAGNTLVRLFGTPAAAFSSLGASNFQLGLAGTVADNLDRNHYARYAAAGLSEFYLRNFPQYINFQLGTNDGRSYYDSLQASVRHTAGNLKLNANYTFSKNIDNYSWDTGSSQIDNFNLGLNRGRGDYDIPHNFNVSVVYALPVGKNQRFGPAWPRWVDALAGGWDLGLLTTLQSGYTRTIASGRATAANTGWANYTGDRKIGGVERKGNGVFYFTPEEVARFSFPAAGEIGTSGRDAFRTAGWRSTDVSLVKRFRLAERQAITFRGEFYNVFNHTSFGNFGVSLLNPATLGKISNMFVGPRIIQAALRYDF